MGGESEDEAEDEARTTIRQQGRQMRQRLSCQRKPRDRGTLYGRRALEEEAAAGSAAGVGCSTRGQSSSKVGEGTQVTAYKRFLFVCSFSIFPKALSVFLIYFPNRDNLPQRHQFGSPPVTKPIAIFHPRDG